MINHKIGMLFKLSRVSLDMQVKEMAEKIEVSSVTIQSFEKMRNQDAPPIVRYLLVLRENGININEILDNVIKSQHNDTE